MPTWGHLTAKCVAFVVSRRIETPPQVSGDICARMGRHNRLAVTYAAHMRHRRKSTTLHATWIKGCPRRVGARRGRKEGRYVCNTPSTCPYAAEMPLHLAFIAPSSRLHSAATPPPHCMTNDEWDALLDMQGAAEASGWSASPIDRFKGFRSVVFSCRPVQLLPDSRPRPIGSAAAGLPIPPADWFDSCHPPPADQFGNNGLPPPSCRPIRK